MLSFIAHCLLCWLFCSITEVVPDTGSLLASQKVQSNVTWFLEDLGNHYRRMKQDNYETIREFGFGPFLDVVATDAAGTGNTDPWRAVVCRMREFLLFIIFRLTLFFTFIFDVYLPFLRTIPNSHWPCWTRSFGTTTRPGPTSPASSMSVASWGPSSTLKAPTAPLALYPSWLLLGVCYRFFARYLVRSLLIIITNPVDPKAEELLYAGKVQLLQRIAQTVEGANLLWSNFILDKIVNCVFIDYMPDDGGYNFFFMVAS